MIYGRKMVDYGLCRPYGAGEIVGCSRCYKYFAPDGAGGQEARRP